MLRIIWNDDPEGNIEHIECKLCEKRKKMERIIRPSTAEERERHAKIRQQVQQEFPPLERSPLEPVSEGIGAQLGAARRAQG